MVDLKFFRFGFYLEQKTATWHIKKAQYSMPSSMEPGYFRCMAKYMEPLQTRYVQKYRV